MTTYFVTRHVGALQWAKQNQLHFDVHLVHLFDLDVLQARDTIIGTLPMNLVYSLNEKGIRYIHLSLEIPSHLRGVELSLDQLNDCKANLQVFVVHKIEFK